MTAPQGPGLAALACCGLGLLLASCSRSGGVGPGGAAGNGGAAQATNGGAGGSVAVGVDFKSLVPARVRRLANAEYDASVQALLSTTASPASGPAFPPDLRQDGFTVNDRQRVDAVIIEQLADAADALATEAQQNGTLARLAPCAASASAAACVRTFVTTFGARVYRRALIGDEVDALLALYAAGAEDATYLDGIAQVTRGLLQSAGFLYMTELGDGMTTKEGTVEMTQNEIAAALSYFLTSAPPDAELLARAAAGALSDPAEREAQARRLFASEPLARDTAVRLVREWLGIDRIAESAKDTLVYPTFESEKPKIVAESEDFVRAVAFRSTGTVSELLGATWTVSSGPLEMYNTVGSGPLSDSTMITGRVGILNQAAFLSAYANAHESHPVFRGVAVARRVACLSIDSPASFNLQVVPPVPDPTRTTRERFHVHSQDAICFSCHRIIDPFGFSFEHFDGMGGYRAQENGRPVDSAVTVPIVAENDFDGPYADSNQLAAALARSQTVRECFARFMFRAATATGDSAATPGESEFIDVWRTIPAAAQGNIIETLIAYVRRPSFGVREAL